jgi:hypothetical protein
MTTTVFPLTQLRLGSTSSRQACASLSPEVGGEGNKYYSSPPILMGGEVKVRGVVQQFPAFACMYGPVR